MSDAQSKKGGRAGRRRTTPATSGGSHAGSCASSRGGTSATGASSGSTPRQKLINCLEAVFFKMDSSTDERGGKRGLSLDSSIPGVVIFTEKKRLRQDTYQQQGLSNPGLTVFTHKKERRWQAGLQQQGLSNP